MQGDFDFCKMFHTALHGFYSMLGVHRLSTKYTRRARVKRQEKGRAMILYRTARAYYGSISILVCLGGLGGGNSDGRCLLGMTGCCTMALGGGKRSRSWRRSSHSISLFSSAHLYRTAFSRASANCSNKAASCPSILLVEFVVEVVVELVLNGGFGKGNLGGGDGGGVPEVGTAACRRSTRARSLSDIERFRLATSPLEASRCFLRKYFCACVLTCVGFLEPT